MGTLTRIAQTTDVPEGKGKAFDVGNRRIALFHVGGQFWALDDACPHAGASLAEGYVAPGKVGCPWHYAEFDLATGCHLSPPAVCSVRAYRVVEEAGVLNVEL